MISQTNFLIIGTILLNISGFVINPLFVDSFGTHKTNSYFVIAFSLITQTFIFIIFSYYKQIKIWTLEINSHKKFVIQSLMWTVNFTFILFACSKARTPIDLQPILSQLNIIFSILLSYFIKKEFLNKFEKIGVSIIILGIIITLLPNCVSLYDSNSDFTYINFFWCIIFIIGIFLYSLSNIYTNTIFSENDNINIYQLIIWGNLYQSIFTGLLFWLNIVPYFGNNSSLYEFGTEFIYGLECFFYECKYTWIIGLLFSVIGCLGFYFSTSLVKNVSANFMILISSISSPLTITFWLLFPNLSNSSFPLINILMDYFGSIFIIIGIIVYIKNNEKVSEIEKENTFIKLDNIEMTI